MGRLDGTFRIPAHDHQIHGPVHGLEEEGEEHRSHKPEKREDDGPLGKIILFFHCSGFHFSACLSLLSFFLTVFSYLLPSRSVQKNGARLSFQ
jgi:hypothetical protein